MDQPPQVAGFRFPRPGKALGFTMALLLLVWTTFAVGINWAGAGADVFGLLVGNTSLILSGQFWRLFTAPLLHLPSGNGAVGHILGSLIGLYFLGPSLEARWGPRRFIAFLYGTALFGFVVHMLLELAAPASISSRLAHTWFGSLSAVEAIAIAWAMSFRNQRMLLMFVFPVSAAMLAAFVVGLSVLRLVAGGEVPEGVVSPFGSMLLAWLLTRKDILTPTSPKPAKSKRANRPRLRVIRGGQDDADETASSENRWLH